MKTDNFWKKIDWLFIFFILVTALVFRWYKITTPLADHHSWRQVDTAAVARNFTRSGFDFLYPHYDDLSGIQSGKLNPQGYRFVEFPLYNAIFGYLHQFFPVLSLEFWGRLTTILFSLILISIIYYLVLKEEGRIEAFFSSLIFSTMPFFVFYSRVILPEMTALTFIFLSIFVLYLSLSSKNNKLSTVGYLLSMIFLSLSLLIKPMTIFYVFAIIYLLYKKFRLGLVKKPWFYVFSIGVFTPFFFWRWWIQRFPEGIPAFDWLFFNVNTYQGLQRIFFRPAFFRWIFYERILNLIFGGYLIIFFILGVLKKPKKSWLFFMFGISAMIYLLTFQGGNVQHDYYQTLILPPLAIFGGIGVGLILKEQKYLINSFFKIPIVLVFLVFAFIFSFYQVKDFYGYSSDLVYISKIINTITPVKAKIVTDTLGDTTLLYLSDRKGYPAITQEPEILKKEGMDYLVTINKETAENLTKKIKLIFKSEKVYIFEL